MLKELKIAKKMLKIAANKEKLNELVKEYAELKNCDIKKIDSKECSSWLWKRLESGEKII